MQVRTTRIVSNAKSILRRDRSYHVISEGDDNKLSVLRPLLDV
jgi:hypothetical protein